MTSIERVQIKNILNNNMTFKQARLSYTYNTFAFKLKYTLSYFNQLCLCVLKADQALQCL